MLFPLGVAAALVTLASAVPNPVHLQERTFNATILSACQAISKAGVATTTGLSLSALQDANHWMTSSSQVPTCIVKPTTPQQLSQIMQTIAAQRLPFAVESGGHASNQGFSSTTGIHITLNGFNGMSLNADQSEFTYGPGHVWDDLYAYLQTQTGGSKLCVGGRVPGVGVGGFAVAGGGYSWLTQSRALTVDNIISMDVVLPNGTITTASSSQNPDLFFALRGAGNDFGIVTSFTVQTVDTSPTVWGGLNIYGPNAVKPFANATAAFSAMNNDPKGNILPTFNSIAGVPGIEFLAWYDAPEAPADFLSAFDATGIQPAINNIHGGRTFSDMEKASPSNLAGGQRGAFHTLSIVEITPAFMDAVVKELEYYGPLALLHSGTLISYDIEPFVKSSMDTATDTPFPHSSDRVLLPVNLYFAWLDPLDDAYWQQELKNSVARLEAAARAEGQAIDPILRYPNYALADTPLVELYGEQNLARLRSIKAAIDPTNIMSLTGGFKITV